MYILEELNMASNEDFTGKIVGIVIALVVVTAVALPIINNAVTEDMDPTLVTIIQIVPVFLILAVLMMVIRQFMGKNKL